MLVLQRAPKETICIGDDITVKLSAIKYDGYGLKAVLAIVAPRELRILRLELYRKRLVDSINRSIDPAATGALVLGLNEDDGFMIGNDIEVVVKQIRSLHFVRIGVSAPRQLPIHRAELRAAELAGGYVARTS